MATFTVDSNIANANGTTIFSTIQEAVDAASTGDIVNILEGTFTLASTLDVNKGITLKGAGEGLTIIDASGVGNDYGIAAYNAAANGVAFEGFTLNGPVAGGTAGYGNAAYGMKIAHVDGVSITNVTVQGSGKTEVDLNDVHNATLTNVTANGALQSDLPVETPTGGNGFSLTNSTNITLDGIATDGLNSWGGVALYPTTVDMTGIEFENGFGVQEDASLFLQEKNGFTATISDFPFGEVWEVENDSFRSPGTDSEQYTFLFGSEADAIAFAAGLASPERSVVSDPDGDTLVTNGMSIQAAIDAASAGDTINVAAGTYTENLLISTNDITLVSVDGRDATTITGIAGAGSLGTIVLANGVNGVTIGDGAGTGFTINGIDNGAPGIENAAIYIQGAHDDLTFKGNDIVANGEAGLLSEYGATVTNVVIDGNIFSGQTFTGANPGGDGFGSQFTEANVPRQLVALGGNGQNTSDVTFTNNQITGTAGGTNLAGDPQGNTLVTIDAANSTISGNDFTGFTNRYASQLRVREDATDITGNSYSNDAGGNVGLYLGITGGETAGTISGNTWTYGAGDDLILATAGNDSIDGGDGIDTYDMTLAGAGGGYVDLQSGLSFSSGTGFDNLTNIENARGSIGNDALLGDAGANTFYATDGSDNIDGRGGNDTYDASDASSGVTVDLGAGTVTGAYNDTLTSIENVVTGSGADNVTTSAGNNTVSTGAGADVIMASAGTDAIDGGDDFDTVSFSGDRGDYTVTWDGTTATVDDGAGNVTTVENAGLMTFATGGDVRLVSTAGDYTSIQAAHTDSSDGDVIMVGAGMFAGATIDKDVTVLGAKAGQMGYDALSLAGVARATAGETILTSQINVTDATTTTIDGFRFENTNALNVNAFEANVTFANNVVVGGVNQFVGGSTGVGTIEITDNYISSASGNGMQINSMGNGDVTVSGNLFNGTGAGAAAVNANGIATFDFSDNVVMNTDSHGVQVAGAMGDVTIDGNTFDNTVTSGKTDRGAISVSSPQNFTGDLDITTNTVTNSPYGVAYRGSNDADTTVNTTLLNGNNFSGASEAGVAYVGNGNANALTGDGESTLFRGFAGDDVITGGGGNDTIDGGDGFDIAAFAGDRSDYTVTWDGTTATVDDGAGNVASVTNAGLLDFQFGGDVRLVSAAGDYTTIQDAVDDSVDGDEIMVGAGSFAGAAIDVNITLSGMKANEQGYDVLSLDGVARAASGETVITSTFDSQGADTAITIAGFRFEDTKAYESQNARASLLFVNNVIINGDNQIASGVAGAGNVVVRGNYINSGTYNGFMVNGHGNGTAEATFTDNLFNGTGVGSVGGSAVVAISLAEFNFSNNVVMNTDSHGIQVADGMGNVTIHDNTFDNTVTSGKTDRGAISVKNVQDFTGDLDITNNTVTNSPYGVAYRADNDAVTTGVTIDLSGNNFSGASQAEIAYLGDADANVMTGGAEASLFRGFAGDDVITGGGGDDTIEGGDGFDTATFAGNFDQYTLDLAAGTSVGPDGMDSFSSVEKLVFDDLNVLIVQVGESIQDAVTAAAPGDLVYVAAGIFVEDVTIPDGITLLGANAGLAGTDGARGAETIIEGRVTVTGDGVTVDGVAFDIDASGAGGGQGVVTMNGAGGTLTNAVMVQDGDGSTVPYAVRINGEGNTVSDSLVDRDVVAASGSIGNPAISVNGADAVSITGSTILQGIIGIVTGDGTSGTVGLTLTGNTITAGSVSTDSIFVTGPGFGAIPAAFAPLSGSIDLAGTTFTTDAGLQVRGTDGADDLSSFATAGNDLLMGNGGDDMFVGSMGTDTLDGGADSDTVSYASATSSIFANLQNQVAYGADIDTDTLLNIESVIGGSGNDAIYGDGAANTLAGGGGDDQLFGAGGDDTFVIGAGNNAISGGAGNDTAELSGDWVDYTIAATGADTFTLNDGTFTNTVSGVESFEFGDVTLDAAHLLNVAPSSLTFIIPDPEVDEDAEGAIVTPLTATDPNTGDILTFSVTDPRFVIADVAGVPTLRLADGVSLDRNDGTTVVNVTVTDAHGLSLTQPLTIEVNNVNQTPGGGGTLAPWSPASVQAGSISAILAPDANIVDPDGDTLTYTLTTVPTAGALLLASAVLDYSSPAALEASLLAAAIGAGTELNEAEFNAMVYHAPNAAGSYQAQFSVSDGSLTDPLTLNLSVNAGVDDVLVGSGGVLDGAAGNDDLRGGATSDVVIGGTGDDLLRGGAGDDTVFGGEGNDRIATNAGNDLVYAGDGDDFVFATDGNNQVFGDAGNDVINGGGGDNELRGGAGNDTIDGGTGDATIAGNAGDDVLSAGSGSNRLYGGQGDDTLNGGTGTDILNGGTGTDLLNGGAGADVFEFRSVADSPQGAARDTIMGFESGVDDIDLSGIMPGLTFVGTGGTELYTDTPGQVRYNDSLNGGTLGRLYIDVDGDGASDFSVDIDGAPTITIDDLIL